MELTEVKHPVTKLVEGQAYVAGPDDYLITERHTLYDILRFLIEQADVEEIQSLIDLKLYE
jgi:hypothetical protein